LVLGYWFSLLHLLLNARDFTLGHGRHKSKIPSADNCRRLTEPPLQQADHAFLPQRFLNFLPLPQGQGSLRPTFGTSPSKIARGNSLSDSESFFASVALPVGLRLFAMSTKETLLEVAQKLPAEATLADAIYELEFRQAVEQGLAELDRGEGIPIEDVKRMVPQWARKSS